mgnify:CR=1 FL=1
MTGKVDCDRFPGSKAKTQKADVHEMMGRSHVLIISHDNFQALFAHHLFPSSPLAESLEQATSDRDVNFPESNFALKIPQKTRNIRHWKGNICGKERQNALNKKECLKPKRISLKR